MNIQLRERNLYSAFVEYLFGSFEKIEVYGPVIFGFYPNAKIEHKRGVTLFAESYKRLGIS